MKGGATARAAAPLEGSGVRRAAPLRREVVRRSSEMTAPIDACAGAARALLPGKTVPRTAVIRAAVAAWLDAAEDANHEPSEVAIQQIRTSLCDERGLHAHPQYWPPEMAARLDLFASTAERALGREVSRSAVARTAIAVWLAAAAHRPPADVAQAIRAAFVKRGRRPKQ